MSSYQLDNIDQKILSFLVKNARMPFLEIARECNVSGAAIHQRVKRLETNGYYCDFYSNQFGNSYCLYVL